jgi:hypothetical protein
MLWKSYLGTTYTLTTEFLFYGVPDGIRARVVAVRASKRHANSAALHSRKAPLLRAGLLTFG